MWSILAVEDQVESRRLVALALEPRLRVEFADGVDEAIRRLETERTDLVLIDVSLSDGDGFQLCSILRGDERFKDIPVVFLTARGETADKVLAFSLGADDYVEKPFDALELRARIEGRLRRLRSSAESAELIRRGDLQLHVPSYRAFALGDGRRTDLGLTPHEFRLLHHLASREERVLSRGQLIEAVWGDTVVSERTVDTHVSNLRRKLGPLKHYIRAVRGAGYSFRAHEPAPAGARIRNP